MSNLISRIHEVSKTDEKTFEIKQNELLHDVLGLIAAEVQAVEDSF